MYSNVLSTKELVIAMVYLLKADKKLIHNIISVPNYNKISIVNSLVCNPNKTQAQE